MKTYWKFIENCSELTENFGVIKTILAIEEVNNVEPLVCVCDRKRFEHLRTPLGQNTSNNVFLLSLFFFGFFNSKDKYSEFKTSTTILISEPVCVDIKLDNIRTMPVYT